VRRLTGFWTILFLLFIMGKSRGDQIFSGWVPGCHDTGIHAAADGDMELSSVFTRALMESSLRGLEGGLESVAAAEPITADPDTAGVGKSPRKAGFLSLILPGAGQIYAGAKVRGLVMIGIEAALWTSYLYHNAQARDKEDEYKAYADRYYDRSRYQEFLDQDVLPYHPKDTPDGDFLRNNFFILPEEKNQQYYEDIGKYDKYIMGWDDWWSWYNEKGNRDDKYDWLYWNNWDSSEGIPNPNSSLREVYKDMRLESNNLFKRAKMMVGLTLFNHVVSVIDAVRAARLHNNSAGSGKGRLQASAFMWAGEPVVAVTWSRKF